MMAVIVDNACTVALLVGLLGGIARGFLEARIAIADAVTFDPLEPMPAAKVLRA